MSAFWNSLEGLLVFNYLGILAGYLLAFITIPRIIRQQHSPGGALAWLLAVLAFPYLAAPLYLLFGGRKMERLARKKTPLRFDSPSARECQGAHSLEHLLVDYNLPPAAPGNRIRLLRSGNDRYRELTRLVESARRQIDLLTYILKPDEIGRDLVGRLARRASQGVAVRVLLDKLGSRTATRRFLAPLLAAGGKLAFFLPEWYRSNLRNHRKMMIVDETTVLSGGANIGNEYLSRNRRNRTWEDLGFVLEGPAVGTYHEIFRTDWEFAANERMPEATAASPARVKPGRAGRMQVIPSGPDVEGDPLYDCLLSAIFAAQSRVWVVTPYFIPDEALMRALRLAALRCVDVRVLLPVKSDHPLVDAARKTFVRELQASGGKVFLYQPGMLHAKAVIQDDQAAIIGTANFDMRSLFLNYEVSLCIYDRACIRDLEAWFLELAGQAVPASLRPGQGTWDGVIRLISPLL